jgi:NADP-dependent 3-hydroxy acid dehydrogenase YdfG
MFRNLSNRRQETVKIVLVTGAGSGLSWRDAIAGAISYAIGQPAGVDVDELVVRPTAQR